MENGGAVAVNAPDPARVFPSKQIPFNDGSESKHTHTHYDNMFGGQLAATLVIS